MTERCLRVAIVGLGPRGTYALERLSAHAGHAGLVVEVDAFESARTPGAGPHYEPTQPPYLRMNLPAGSVDMWPPAGRPAARKGFVAWMRSRGTPVPADGYLPRGVVGEYLAEGLSEILSSLPKTMSVRVLSGEVSSITRDGGRWWVDVAGAGRHEGYDEVLLTTGHRVARTPDELARPAGAVLIAPPYPTERQLSQRRVPAGAVVAVRGFALTFIDCALALSEGRGGSFASAGDGPFMRYLPGGREPGAILPFSRGGRSMHAKPAAALTAGRADLEAIASAGRAEIAGLPDGPSVSGDLAPALAAAAACSLEAMTAPRREVARCERMLDDMLAGSAEALGGDPRRALADSIAMASGRQRVGAAWALGHVWRTLYPAVVDRLSGDGLDEDQWPTFHRLAAEMERVAFGPGLENAARLLALIDSGLVCLDHVAGGSIVACPDGAPALGSPAGVRRVDLVVDAVLAPPGVTPGDPLVGGLVEAGHVRVAPGRRGLDVDTAGHCRDRHGEPAPGLAAIGRVTEDVVIGNDTLSRTLHRTPDLWAGAVVARARACRPGQAPAALTS